MRRFMGVAACALVLVGGASPARAAAADRVLVIGLPETQARSFLVSHPAALGLGVFPDSRAPAAFLMEVGVAAPRGRGGDQGKLRSALDAAGRSVAVAVTADARATPAFALAPSFASDTVGIDQALEADVAVVIVGLAEDAEALVRAQAEQPAVIVIGVGARTPLLIAKFGTPGLLDGGVAERPGVVTPYDIAATIAKLAGATPVAGGRVLGVKPTSDPMHGVDLLRARFERDRGFGLGLTAVTAGFGIAGGAFGVLFAALKRRRLAAALARGGAMVPAGYVGALFVPSARWEVRSIVIAGAFLLGFITPAKSTRRFCGVVVLVTTVAIGVLTVVASRNPGGEPALSLWGDPINSWRFFGIRNHLSAFLAGGYVLGTALLRTPIWLMAPGAAAAGVVVGAPTLGAQFIGVLTLSFAAALELLGALTRRVRLWHVPVSIVVAAGGAAAALLADAGKQISHGGRAVESIRQGGASAAWDLFRLRARLNYQEISGLGPKGWIAFVLCTLALAWLFWWALRSRDLAPLLRAGVAGVAAAGLAALVVEDSGFLTGGIFVLYPALGFAAGYADLGSAGAGLGSGLAPPDQPPRDAGEQDDAHGDAGE